MTEWLRETSEAASAREIATLSDLELRGLYQDGFSRVGVLPLILDSYGNILLLQHRQSDKTESGMWGTLGETSKVRPEGTGWVMEPPSVTVLRGIQEELGVTPQPEELRQPDRVHSFHMSWPVGVNHAGASAYAICPVLVVSDQLRAAILAAPPTAEIARRQFMSPDQINNLTFMRPGMLAWLMEADKTITVNLGAALSRFHVPPVQTEAFTDDAILVNMYGHHESNTH